MTEDSPLRSRHRAILSFGPSLAVLATFYLVLWAPPLGAQDKNVQELPPEDIEQFQGYLQATLATPTETAFLQILTEVVIARDITVDTTTVYDLVVRYDPNRYREPTAGAYPLDFTDQMVLWAKRIARFTNRTPWVSGRFFLHDISTGRQAWIFTESARRLYFGDQEEKAEARTAPLGSPEWSTAMTKTESSTELRTMGRWQRSIRHERREKIQRRNKSTLEREQ